MFPIKLISLHAGRAEVWSNGAEQYAVHLTYDVGTYLEKWPDAVLSVAFQRADGEKYAHAWELDGTVMHIPLTLADTAVSGMCKCMATLTSGDGIANTMVFYGSVTQGIHTLGETPSDPQQGIIEQVNAAAVRAEKAADRAEISSGERPPNFTDADAGKLLYIGEDGKVKPLTLGEGLSIVDGVLTIDAKLVRAVAGMALAGQVNVGEV